jgi:hypothetical protein
MLKLEQCLLNHRPFAHYRAVSAYLAKTQSYQREYCEADSFETIRGKQTFSLCARCKMRTSDLVGHQCPLSVASVRQLPATE